MNERFPKDIHLSETVTQRLHKTPTKVAEETIWEKQKESPTPPLLDIDDGPRIKYYLEEWPSLPSYHDEILLRLGEEVPSLTKNFEELGIDQDLFEEDLSGVKHGVNVEWEAPDAIERDVEGLYYSGKREISMGFTQPSYADRIISLATTGKMHRSLLVYAHEFTHDLQYQGLLKPGPFTDTPDMAVELKEAQAYLISDGHVSLEAISEEIVSAKYKNGEQIYKNVDKVKLDRALKAFRLLNILGVSQIEIAKLVRSPGHWNEHNDFSNIFDKLIQAKKGRDICDETILERKVLQQKQDRYKVRSIVCNELTQILGEKVVGTA